MNDITRTLVFGLTLERAIKKAEVLVSEVGTENVKRIMKGIYDYTIEFKNGDYIRAVELVDCSCGQKCNVAYVDRDIGLKCYQEIIMPMIWHYSEDCIKLY